MEISMDETVEVLGEGRHLRLLRRRGWEFAERRHVSGIVVLVAVTPAGELLLVEQHREPVGAPVIELPAGLAGDDATLAGESLEQAAARELREETGWDARSWERLSAGPPTAGLSSEVVTLMRGRGLVRHGRGGGTGDERILVHAVPLPDVRDWLARQEANGRLVDPKVWAGLWFAGDSRLR
jgi:ADP-ribose pyrophosphatase